MDSLTHKVTLQQACTYTTYCVFVIQNFFEIYSIHSRQSASKLSTLWCCVLIQFWWHSLTHEEVVEKFFWYDLLISKTEPNQVLIQFFSKAKNEKFCLWQTLKSDLTHNYVMCILITKTTNSIRSGTIQFKLWIRAVLGVGLFICSKISHV